MFLAEVIGQVVATTGQQVQHPLDDPVDLGRGRRFGRLGESFA